MVFTTSSEAIFSDCTDLRLQIVVYNVFRKKEQKTSRNLSHSFHILKTKAHFEKELHPVKPCKHLRCI